MLIPRLQAETTVLLVIDLQEKLLPHIQNDERVVENSRKLICGCAALEIPAIATEQNPRKLGGTVEAISEVLPEGTMVESKLKFSAYVEAVRKKLGELRRPNILLCGVETHVCVQQTALDLADHGFRPFLATDAVFSRKNVDHETALERMKLFGTVPVTVESALLEMVVEAGIDAFRQVLPIIK